MNTMSRDWRILAALMATMAAGSIAGCAGGPDREGHGGGPPPAALDACIAKASSDGCSFEDGGRLISGACEEHGGDWVCVPEGGPKGGRSGRRGGPDSDEGGRGVGGAISPGGASSSRGGKPTPPREAFDACLGLAMGAECVVKTPDRDVDGTCSDLSDRLACVPRDASQRPTGSDRGSDDMR